MTNTKRRVLPDVNATITVAARRSGDLVEISTSRSSAMFGSWSRMLSVPEAEALRDVLTESLT